jgi:KaiC/GvpD/RAD55 family RecA-like ATPase
VGKAYVWLMILLVGMLATTVPHEVRAVPSGNIRTFYLASPSAGLVTPSQPGTLSTTVPSGTSSRANVTAVAISFVLPTPLAIGLTIQSPSRMSLLIDYEFNKTAPATVQGAFSYRFPGVSTWTNSNSTRPISNGLTNVTFDLPVSTTQLVEQSSIAIELSVASLPKNGTVAVVWGSSSSRSLVAISMSGYATLFPSSSTNPVDIKDSNGGVGPVFYLNSLYTLLEVKVFVQSALGLSDIQRVNMTIFDPHGDLVKKDEPMQGPLTGPCPCAFVGVWSYATNSTQGTYQVLVDIVDVQGNVAYASTPSASTFLLEPPGYIPFPYNLLPYIIIGGIAATGGAAGGIFYRRRKSKSYLIPFDHFNTLTGGELTGGTVVTVEGNTGSGKTRLLEQLMGEDLRKVRPCVFVSTADFPNNVRMNMKAMGIDVSGYEQSGLLTFVDGYSAEAGQESHEKVSIPSLGDLTTTGIKITSVLPSSFKGGSLFFDSLTPLASKAKPESIVSFVQSVGAKVKGLSGKAFFTVGLGLDTTVQRQLEDMADCIVQMEAFEEAGTRKRRLRITKFRARKHQEGWALFTIEDGKGIIFYSKKPQQ